MFKKDGRACKEPNEDPSLWDQPWNPALTHIPKMRSPIEYVRMQYQRNGVTCFQSFLLPNSNMM